MCSCVTTDEVIDDVIFILPLIGEGSHFIYSVSLGSINWINNQVLIHTPLAFSAKWHGGAARPAEMQQCPSSTPAAILVSYCTTL